MPEVACDIIEWIADEPFPGLVRAVLTDATGTARSFVGKAAIFTAEPITAATAYPTPGCIRCVVTDRIEGETVRIDTSRPDGVGSEEGLWTFEVASALVSD